MLSHRTIRVGDQIKKEIAAILCEEMRDPQIGFVTVTHVQVSNDLQFAKVYLSIQQSQDEKKTFASLKRASGFIRGKLSHRLPLRKTPALTFLPDRKSEKTTHLFDLLDEIRLEDTSGNKGKVIGEESP